MKIRKSLAMLGASAAMALGFGGVMAPSAQAHTHIWDDATYTQSDLRGSTVRSGTAFELPGGTARYPRSARSLHCWASYVSHRTSAVECSGTYWRAYADCSDGERYVTPAMSGAKRVAVRCPVGTSALNGGAFGR